MKHFVPEQSFPVAIVQIDVSRWTMNETNNSIDPTTGTKIREKIQQDLNPGRDFKHNSGKPKAPSYAPKDHRSAATYLTSCSKENRASLQCIERNYQNRQACEEFFQAYKACRREENEQKRKATYAEGKKDGWFW